MLLESTSSSNVRETLEQDFHFDGMQVGEQCEAPTEFNQDGVDREVCDFDIDNSEGSELKI